MTTQAFAGLTGVLEGWSLVRETGAHGDHPVASSPDRHEYSGMGLDLGPEGCGVILGLHPEAQDEFQEQPSIDT